MPTAAFTTLGCKVNQYETQRILDSFAKAGFQVVPFNTIADVYVINTCSVTAQAETKSAYTVRQAARRNPEGKIVVTGCSAQMATNQGEAFPGADLVVANPEKLETWQFFAKAFPGLAAEAAQNPAPPDRPKGRTRATLKIQDGCSVFCSYCSIPFTRPAMTSRPASEVLSEAGRLVAMDYHELVLTGVLIGAYGPETGSGGPIFEDLVERLAVRFPATRLRISSIEMRQVTPQLIDMLAAGLVVPHLHIPLQSGDSGVLAEMNRPYSQRGYLELCERLYRNVPDFSLTTDVMVGFPTENEERFQSTLHVAREARYLKAHVFPFSPRPGTPADRRGDPVPPQEKQRRSALLSEIAAQTGLAHRRRFLGRTLRVLVEDKVGPDGLLLGLTDNYLEVRFAGPRTLVRSFAHVRLDEMKEGALYGELAAFPSQTLPMVR